MEPCRQVANHTVHAQQSAHCFSLQRCVRHTVLICKRPGCRDNQSSFHAMKPDGLGRSRSTQQSFPPRFSSHARTDALMHCMRWHIWTFDPMLDPYTPILQQALRHRCQVLQ